VRSQLVLLTPFDRGSWLSILHLCCSFALHPKYQKLRGTLEQSLPCLDGTLPTPGDENINALLEVIRAGRERGKEVRERVEEDEMEGVEDEVEGVEDEMEGVEEEMEEVEEEMEEVEEEEEEEEEEDQHEKDQNGNPADKTSQPQDPVGDAVEILLKNATEEFGFSPRDVYGGVLDLPKTRSEHADAVNQLDHSVLVTLVRVFHNQHRLDDLSHHVVVVHPRRRANHWDGWKIDFKSVRIRTDVESRMRLAEDEHLRERYHLLREIPEGSVLAGWIFEAIVHRELSGGCQEPTPQPIRMSKRGNPPVFSTDPPAATPALPPPALPPPAPLRADKRTVTQIDFRPRSLSGVTLDKDKYYKPARTNNPLFDSFTIDHDPVERTVVISVFQITISQNHRGSVQGYVSVRKIMNSVRNLLRQKDTDAKIKVIYFLVCSEDGSKRNWRMPNGWSDRVKRNNHRGDAFCLRVPVSTHNAPNTGSSKPL